MLRLVLILLACLIVFTPLGRFCLMNFFYFIHYVPVDIYKYFKFKKYNECNYFGYIKVFCANIGKRFGCGKTLSATDEVIAIYKRYNNLDVWNEDMKCFIKQKITIVSNVELRGVPYVQFTSERQFIDFEVGPSEIVLFLVDEIGTVWNNRDFKSFNPDVFANIVQSRKRKMAIYGTLPVFQGTDINIRRFTDKVIICSKFWRIVKTLTFNAQDLENCSDITMLQPLSVSYKFCTDLTYNQYDTSAMIEKLTSDMADGRLLTFNELNTGGTDGSFSAARLKKRFRKRQGA